MDIADGGAEQGQVIESMQMRQKKDSVIKILSESDTVYDSDKNVELKESWIDFAKKQLLKPTPEGQDTEMVASILDASLGNQEQRGFVAAYLSHMGSSVDVARLKEIVSEPNSTPTIDSAQLYNPDLPNLFWVEDVAGRKKLFSATKLDGVKIELDMSGIGEGPDTTGLIHPILHISK